MVFSAMMNAIIKNGRAVLNESSERSAGQWWIAFSLLLAVSGLIEGTEARVVTGVTQLLLDANQAFLGRDKNGYYRNTNVALFRWMQANATSISAAGGLIPASAYVASGFESHRVAEIVGGLALIAARCMIIYGNRKKAEPFLHMASAMTLLAGTLAQDPLMMSAPFMRMIGSHKLAHAPKSPMRER